MLRRRGRPHTNHVDDDASRAGSEAARQVHHRAGAPRIRRTREARQRELILCRVEERRGVLRRRNGGIVALVRIEGARRVFAAHALPPKTVPTAYWISFPPPGAL